MRVGDVTSFASFGSSTVNDTLAAKRWINDSTADIWLHGFWTWDWADSFQRVKRILAPPAGSVYHASWGADEGQPTVAACGGPRALSPLQQQWNFTTVNTNLGPVDHILVNAYAPATLPVWAGGTGTPSHPGPAIFNCQKQLIWTGECGRMHTTCLAGLRFHTDLRFQARSSSRTRRPPPPSAPRRKATSSRSSSSS